MTTTNMLEEWPTAPIKNQAKPTGVKMQPKPELDPMTLKGVYRDAERGLYRAAVRPTNSQTWYTLGYFVCPHVAAYVFNVYALTMGLGYLLNNNLQPDKEELNKWRARKPENVEREKQANQEYLNQRSTLQ